MKTCQFEITMRFTSDAILTMKFRDLLNGQYHTVRKAYVCSWDDSYYGDRKEMNQRSNTYVFRIDDIPESWEVDIENCIIQFGWIDRRSCQHFCEGSPFRTDRLPDLVK